LPPLSGPSASAADGQAVQVLIDRMDPAVAKPGRTITLSGRVVNTGTKVIDQVDVGLRLRSSDSLFRGGIDSADEAGSAGTPRGAPTTKRNLGPGVGAAQPWTLTLKADGQGLGAAGAYPLTVEARIGAKNLGSTRTFLPWIPNNGLKNVKDVQVAMV
jgi:hypothetical protein